MADIDDTGGVTVTRSNVRVEVLADGYVRVDWFNPRGGGLPKTTLIADPSSPDVTMTLPNGESRELREVFPKP